MSNLKKDGQNRINWNNLSIILLIIFGFIGMMAYVNYVTNRQMESFERHLSAQNEDRFNTYKSIQIIEIIAVHWGKDPLETAYEIYNDSHVVVDLTYDIDDDMLYKYNWVYQHMNGAISKIMFFKWLNYQSSTYLKNVIGLDPDSNNVSVDF